MHYGARAPDGGGQPTWPANVSFCISTNLFTFPVALAITMVKEAGIYRTSGNPQYPLKPIAIVNMRGSELSNGTLSPPIDAKLRPWPGGRIQKEEEAGSS